MLHARKPALCLLAALGLTLALAAPARAQMDSFAVSPVLSDAATEPLALGFDLWLAAQLEAAGLAGASVDAAPDLAGALAVATHHGFAHVLVPQLSARAGEVTLRVLLYVPDSRTLLVGGRERAALAEFGTAAKTVLERVLPQLGAPDTLEITPPLLEDLTSSTQSVLARRAGDLPGAFRAVQGKLTPTAMALREAIVDQARESTTPATIRARVLNAVGDPVSAWALIGHTARAELQKSEPDVDLLVAAGEVMISQGAAAQARKYLDRALEISPDHLDAAGALAELFDLEGDTASARSHLLRAARLDAGGSRFPEQLARIEPDAAASAAQWIEAGRRSVQQLDAQRARRQFDEAVSLDPQAAASAGAEVGALEERLGRPGEALLAYRRAVQGGVKTPVVLTALGRNEHRTGATKQAEKTLQKALDLEPENPSALRELGVVYTETGRESEALPMLEQANQLQPGDSRGRITLSRALRATGDADEALALLTRSTGEAPVEELNEVASIHRQKGDLEAARQTLEQAVLLEPADPELRNRFAEVLEQLGDPAAAAAQREFADAFDPNREGGAKPREFASVLSLDDLVMTFAAQVASPHTRAVALLGVREPRDWKTRVLQVLRPRSPDLPALERGLRAALAARFDPNGASATIDPALSLHVDQLFDYGSDRSLDAGTIATLNEISALDGVFTAQLVAQPGVMALLNRQEEATCDAGEFAIDMRLLTGRDAELASILSNLDCLAGGFEAYGRWNVVALSIYGVLALFILWPMLRGWGQIVVQIRLPDRTKGFFSIHITKRPDKVKREVSEKSRREKSKGKRFDFLMRFQRHMAGAETFFRLIPARRQPYTVTVSGPLMDARGEEIVGHFLEEQRATVRRRKPTTLLFDFRPKEVAVEVTVREAGRPAPGARVGVQGDPSSLRYARDGVAYLYLGLGSYTVLVGSAGSAASFEIEISSLDSAIPLEVDMARPEGLVFQDCPDAVEPYLQSDLSTAARALDNAGNARAAHLLRAELYRQQGRTQEAAQELEAAGDIGAAAEMHTAGEDFEGGAALYEDAGEIDRAARAYREAGRFAEAARCYEQAYDYGNALECWREAGDSEHEMVMLGKLGEYMDAAQIAKEIGQREQVIEYLQHIEPRHAQFGDACRMLAEIASEDGDHDLAVAKFEEALASTGIEAASVETLESYAKVLEAAGRKQEAVSAYEAIRRQDVGRTDIATRIQTLKQELTQLEEAKTQAVPAPAAPAESRYELLEEIGRGGMGVVWKARDKRLGRVVALKRLPENLRDHPAAAELFEREARAAASLNHVNIVTVFDADEENGTYFITMELLEGRPLNEILDKNGRVSVADTMRLGIQICAGLAYAHDRRIVHRDIKTANLFFTREQVVKIMDFGIAKSMEEVRRSTTVLGGTPYYMAPEQSSGEGVDHRADLYALGVTLFQLASGQLPFEDGDVAYRHRHEEPPDPREVNVKIPAGLAKLILSLMEKEPEARPESASVVAARLQELLAER